MNDLKPTWRDKLLNAFYGIKTVPAPEPEFEVFRDGELTVIPQREAKVLHALLSLEKPSARVSEIARAMKDETADVEVSTLLLMMDVRKLVTIQKGEVAVHGSRIRQILYTAVPGVMVRIKGDDHSAPAQKPASPQQGAGPGSGPA